MYGISIKKVTANLIKPVTRYSNTMLVDLDAYTTTLNRPITDSVLIINLKTLLPPINTDDTELLLHILENVIMLDYRKAVVTVDMILKTTRLEPTRDNLYIVNFILNSYYDFKVTYNMNQGVIMLGYEINTEMAHVWSFK